MKCLNLFSRKNKKNISVCCLLEILPRVLSIKVMSVYGMKDILPGWAVLRCRPNCFDFNMYSRPIFPRYGIYNVRFLFPCCPHYNDYYGNIVMVNPAYVGVLEPRGRG